MKPFSLSLRIGFVALLIGGLCSFPATVNAQTSPFLITPYYGITSINQGYHTGHRAYDFNLIYTQVLAADGGNIEDLRWYSNAPECHQTADSKLANTCGFGLHIRIRHSNNYLTIYGHLSSTAFGLNSVGTAVRKGQIIGTSGHTGYSTGPHLHFEVRPPNSNLGVDPFNPNLWEDGQWASPSRPIPAPISGGEMFVDDTTDNSAGFSKGYGGLFSNPCTGNCGNWTAATHSSAYGNDMYHTPADGNTTVDNWAKWQAPTLFSPAGMGTMQEIFVHIPSINATSWQAPYTLVNGLGQTVTTGVVDQYGLNDRWISIGTYYVTGSHYLYTTDATQEIFGQHCGAGQWCRLGVDAVKFVRRGTTYLPDLRTSDDWTSNVVVRNNGGGSATVHISFFNSSGEFMVGITNLSLPSHGTWTWPWPACSGCVSAIVDADQDVTVTVANQRSSAPYTRGAYTGIAADKTSSTFYVPLLLHQRSTASGQGNAELIVQNAGASSTTVSMRFYDGSGSLSYTRNVNLMPRASDRYSLDHLPTEWYGSAVVSASGGGQIAVVFNVTTWSGVTVQTFNAFPANSPGLQWFVPLFLSRRATLTGNVSTPINVQNVSGTTIPANGIVLSCLAAPGSGFSNLTVSNPQALGNNTAYSFNPVVDTTNFPTGWYGSCRVSASHNVVVLTQIRYPGNLNSSTYYYLASGYEAIRASGTNRQAFLPVIQKRLSDGSATSVVVQNLNTSSAAQVTFYYKASSACGGCGDVTVGPYTIPAGDSINHNHRLEGLGSGSGYHGLPDGWFGSLRVVSSNQPIDGFAQLTNIYNTSGDTIMAHNAGTRP
jgi:hypothetical protein